MGLKDVLSKMKLVEVDSESEAAGAPAPNGPTAGLAPPFPGAPGPGRTPKRPGHFGVGPAARPDRREGPARGPGRRRRRDPRLRGRSTRPRASRIRRTATRAYKVLEILASPELRRPRHQGQGGGPHRVPEDEPRGPGADHRHHPGRGAPRPGARQVRGVPAHQAQARAKEIEKENAALQAEIDELDRAQPRAMEANRRALEAEQARLARWQPPGSAPRSASCSKPSLRSSRTTRSRRGEAPPRPPAGTRPGQPASLSRRRRPPQAPASVQGETMFKRLARVFKSWIGYLHLLRRGPGGHAPGVDRGDAQHPAQAQPDPGHHPRHRDPPGAGARTSWSARRSSSSARSRPP